MTNRNLERIIMSNNKRFETVYTKGRKMKLIAVNGSPRKNGNTAKLLQAFLDGAKEAQQGVETEIIQLYDLQYTGCRSCFACKSVNDKLFGKCAIRDDIHDILERVSYADVVAFGSPIYLGEMTGQLKSFLERLLFPYYTYQKEPRYVTPKRMQTCMIYTSNADQEEMHERKFDIALENMQRWVADVLTEPEVMQSYCTYQFMDYSKVRADRFSEKERAKIRNEQFPLDLQKAFDLGKKLVLRIKEV